VYYYLVEEMDIGNQQESIPTKCINSDCSFFGNAETLNMCSVCFRSVKNEKKRKEHDENDTPLMKKAKIEAEPLPIEKSEVVEPPKDEPKIVPILEQPKQEGEEQKKEALRCEQCKKKVPLSAIKCRCGFVFCGKHRYPEQHTCSFDYKEMARKELISKNPQIVAPKIKNAL